MTLGNGHWYWQVLSHEKPNEFLSNIQSFNIQKFKPLDIVSPPDDTLLISKPQDSIIFRWKPSNQNSAVHFSLSSDEQFKKIVKEEVVIAPSIVVKGLKKGKYYWKVQPYFGKKIAEGKDNFDEPEKENSSQTKKNKKKLNNISKTTAQKHTFVIDDTQKKIESPKDLKPSYNFSIPAGLSKNVRFSWSSVIGANTYELEIYLNQEKKANCPEKK